jgi:hypothetical protein
VTSALRFLTGRLKRVTTDMALTPPGDGASASASPLPLSLEQESFFGLDPVVAPPMAVTFRLEGPVDLAALQAASFLLLQRHEGLRFRVAGDGPQPAQVIVAPDEIIPEPTAVSSGQVWEQVNEAQRTPLDLCGEGPLRIRLYRTGPDDHVLSMIVHPAALDAWGFGIITRELWTLYDGGRSQARADLPDLPLSFSDHVRGQHATGSRLTVLQRDTHLRQLADMSQLRLPWHRGEQPSTLWPGQAFALDPALVGKISRVARETHVTTAAILLAGFQLALGMAAGAGARAGSLSYIFLGRDRPDTQGMAAAMARRVPLRFEMTPSARLRDFIQLTMQTWATAIGNSGPPYSSARLTREAGGRLDALEPVFNLRVPPNAAGARAAAGANGAGAAAGADHGPRLRITPAEGTRPRPVPMWPQFGGTALFALVTLGVKPVVTPIYDPSQVPESTVRAIFGHYEHVIHVIAEGEPLLTVGQLNTSPVKAL